MTRVDLQLEYRFDTGEYPATDAEYANWLEDQLLFIRNRFDIVDADILVGIKQLDARMEKIKKARDEVYKERFGI
jgi:hypothetical protein